jgi:hypothetical protein
MSSPGDCLQRADDPKRRAAKATDPLVKSAYERMAEYWMLLARLDSLLHDEKNNDDKVTPYRSRCLMRSKEAFAYSRVTGYFCSVVNVRVTGSSKRSDPPTR